MSERLEMSEMKPCPFCGSDNVKSEEPLGIIYCWYCGADMATDLDEWNTRPIEDDLRKRIAELEAMVDKLIEAGEVMKQACEDQWGWEDMFYDPEFTNFDDLAAGWKEREK